MLDTSVRDKQLQALVAASTNVAFSPLRQADVMSAKGVTAACRFAFGGEFDTVVVIYDVAVGTVMYCVLVNNSVDIKVTVLFNCY